VQVKFIPFSLSREKADRWSNPFARSRFFWSTGSRDFFSDEEGEEEEEEEEEEEMMRGRLQSLG